MVLGGKLKEFVGNLNLIFLKIKANNDSNIADITFKDERKFKNNYKLNYAKIAFIAKHNPHFIGQMLKIQCLNNKIVVE